jgi:hypothetical protein
MVDALNARDWRALGQLLDERTVVEDHRELPFVGHGAAMLGVWRSAFEASPTGVADLEVLEASDHAALLRLGVGDEEGLLVVHAVVEVGDGRIARFEAFPRTADGERRARERFGG